MSRASFRPTPAMKSRQVRPNRGITGKRGVPYCGCPKTGNQAGRGFPSRAHARLRHLIGPRSSRSCCQPTPLQRTASLAGRAPCGRGRRTPSASARGQRSTTSAWIAPTCVVSVVSLYQAGGPSTARRHCRYSEKRRPARCGAPPPAEHAVVHVQVISRGQGSNRVSNSTLE